MGVLNFLLEAGKLLSFNCRISKAVESIPRQMKKQKEFSQSAELIVIEARAFPRSQFTGIQCSRLDLSFDPTAHRLIQSPTGFVFVCSEPVNDTNYAFLNVVSTPKPLMIDYFLFKRISLFYLAKIDIFNQPPTSDLHGSLP